MNNLRKIICVLIIGIGVLPGSAQNDVKTRSESFWGVHFDRHTQLTDEHIGSTLTEGMIDSVLKAVRPDYIQVDSKGHPGVSSYPTFVGQQAAGYDKDPLALIREVTWKRNVALYVHHSGVMDINYVRLHPEEGRRNIDGKPDGQNISFWGNYADQLLIPQLKELALKYKVDGVWIDGESWAVYPDYHPEAIKEFKQVSGLNYMPVVAEDPNYKILLEFNRRKFIGYIDHYTSELKKVAPDFQLCSNWAFSALMPEPVPGDMKLDFLSGDYDPDDALNTANWNARCLSGQGLPYDLMAWSFVRHSVPKTALQLCQEAAAVISLGGGCQMYFRQNQDLSFQPASFGIMEDVANFVLPRREFCKGITPIPQIALFYSTAGWKQEVNDIYRPFGVNGIRGILNALLDGQQAVEVLMTHHLEKRMEEYPVIVIPEWKMIEPELIVRLKEYVKNGGNLLVIGADATVPFDDVLGVKQTGKDVASCLGYDDRFVDVQGNYRKIQCNPGTQPLAQLYKTNDFRFPSGIAASVNQYGKGKVAGIYTNLGESYLATTSPVFRDFLSEVISELFSEPLVTVEGSHRINVVPATKDGRMFIQLVNTSGDHANRQIKGIDEIPVLTDIKVTVNMDNKPKRILLQPEGRTLKFSYAGKKASFTIPRLEIHDIVEIVK